MAGDERRRGLDAMRAGDWERAVALLEPAAAGGDPLAVNDLAAALVQAGRMAEAAARLAALDEATLPALVRLHRFYLGRVSGILADFDFSWKHTDHDGAPCPERRPAVSVIVRTFNRVDSLVEALASLKAQTFSDFETIVVNDGGDPAAEAAVKAAGLVNPRYFHAPHGGCWSAMNYGLEIAHGRFVTGLDDDDLLYPDHLQRLCQTLDAGAADVVYPAAKVVHVGGSGADRVFTPAGVRGWPFDRERLRRTNLVPSVMALARRECYEEAGRFCSRLPVGGDWEMWLRLSERFRFTHVNAVTAEIREGAPGTNLTSRSAREKYLWDNTFLMMRGALILASEPRDPRLAGRFRRRLLPLLDRALAQDPEAFPFINLRGLWEMQKPYAWFADQARWFRDHGMTARAAAFYHYAFILSPLQPKLWAGMLRAPKAAP
jgi:glycosyltransferase involved in cell wall biosynthesis